MNLHQIQEPARANQTIPALTPEQAARLAEQVRIALTTGDRRRELRQHLAHAPEADHSIIHVGPINELRIGVRSGGYYYDAGGSVLLHESALAASDACLLCPCRLRMHIELVVKGGNLLGVEPPMPHRTSLSGSQRCGLIVTGICCAVCSILIPWPQERLFMALGGGVLLFIIWQAMRMERQQDITERMSP